MREQSGCLPAWPRRAEGFEPVTQGLEPLELSHVPGRKRGQAGQEGLEEQRLGAKRERERSSLGSHDCGAEGSHLGVGVEWSGVGGEESMLQKEAGSPMASRLQDRLEAGLPRGIFSFYLISRECGSLIKETKVISTHDFNSQK